MKLVLATHNVGKLREMETLLKDCHIDLLSATDAGILTEVIEDGVTFAENALKKAREISAATNAWALADDSGICIDALNGAPGVYTARWAGEGASDDRLVEYTLEQLKDVSESNRQAAFVCVIAIVSPEGEEWTFEGRVSGRIPLEPRGNARPKLPYDCIFIPEDKMQTFAEMSEEEKHMLSHRGRALEKAKEFLKEKNQA